MGRRLHSLSLAILLLTLAACPGCAQKAPTADTLGTLRFIESYPEETELDMPSLDQAHQVWPQVLAKADNSVNVASFYFSRQGDGNDAYAPEGVADLLAPVIQDLKKAADRGCQVRVLGDGKFYETYPEALTWLDEQDGIAARHIDARAHWGGVMHAKYFVVDDRILFVGSQNWDWRAMTQIHELGALVEHPRLALQLKQIFDLDWSLAQAASPAEVTNAEGHDVFSTGWNDVPPALLTTVSGDTVQAILAASPPQALPDGVPWDLPLIVETIDAASTQVRLQLLSYGVTDRENRFFATLDNALRRAATRKVKVQIILANWSKRHYALPWIQSLAAVPNIEIKFSNIPEHSKGFIPFARVEHAKFLTVDGTAAWTGTSNWSRDYFYSSRNISLFFRGAAAVDQLNSFFQISWDGPFTETVDPCGQYSPPKRN